MEWKQPIFKLYFGYLCVSSRCFFTNSKWRYQYFCWSHSGILFIYSCHRIGLTLGSLIGFAIGKYAAKPLAKKILSQEDLERSEEAAKKFGISILLIARPAPALAEISTVAAGLAGMKWSTFLTVMIVSNLLIAVVLSLIHIS